ncbi:MAG: mechanosensitive ion channel family protein [Planctomycetes bacterium]|nr:mechanosensitive ion channel family protein [Planctomycetota bacterium]
MCCALGVCSAAPARRAQGESAPAQQSAQRFETPRQTIEAFLSAYKFRASGDPAQRERAASAFESRKGLAGLERAAEFADRLAKTFDHVTFVDPERVERELAFQDELHATWSVVSEIDPTLSIELGFLRTEDRGWVIDAATESRIYGWYTRAADLERIASASTPLSTTEIVRRFVPRQLKGGGILLEPWQWIGLLLLFLLAFFSERLLTISVRPVIRKLSRFEGVNLPLEILARFERPFGWLLLAWLWLAGIQLLDLPTGVYAPLRIGVGFFTTVMTVWTVYALVEVGCWPLKVKADRSENKFDDMLVPLLRRTLKLLVILVGLVFIVSRITGDLWHVLAGLSIGSLAVGFAAKDSIENLFGTFTVLLDGPFKIGDAVKVGDIEGSVEEVGFRSTRIRTPEDSLISVPNSRFIASHVDNLGQRRMRRVKLTLGLTYDTPPEKIESFCEGVRELIRAHPLTRNENYHVWFGNYGASSLDIDVICFIGVTDHATYLRERHRLYLDILRLAKLQGVAFAFPTQTVWHARAEDLVHHDVPRDGAQAVLEGRAQAKQLASDTVGKLASKPQPVRFEPDNPDAIVH